MEVRAAVAHDLQELVDVQEAVAVEALAHIFPQDRYPFPRAVVLDRWARELDDPAIHVYVSVDDDAAITGFAATREAELLHFGTAASSWGTGLARDLHDAVIADLSRRMGDDIERIWLRVFEQNVRARRFYEKLGWRPNGIRTRTSFEPHPVLLGYERPLR